MTEKPKRLLVLCSGGDSQGMNAALRAAARIAMNKYGMDVYGAKDGYKGLVDTTDSLETGSTTYDELEKQIESNVGISGIYNGEARIFRMDHRSVSGIVDRGGTILGTAREERFKEKEIRAKVYDVLTNLNTDGMIVIGGDGSLTGAKAFHEETGFPVVGIPASIDNDIPGTDMSIGFDTARNIAADAIHKIKETADACHRIIIVEVMGRDSGELALSSAIASGAEIAIIPERDVSQRDRVNRIAGLLARSFEKGRRHAVVVVAEGVKLQIEKQPPSVSEYLRTRFDEFFNDATSRFRPMSVRTVVLSQLQRGGAPSAADRCLAMRYADAAVDAIANGSNDTADIVVLEGNRIAVKDIAIVADRSLKEAMRNRILEQYAAYKVVSRAQPLTGPVLDS